MESGEISSLNERAHEVDLKLGRSLSFMLAPNPEFAFLVAATPDGAEDPAGIGIYGPVRVDEVTVHEIDMLLDQLESGQRRIERDEDGDPRLL